ncbi:MAG: RNA polymerase-binding protein DksA [Rhodanobacter denitrificans]|uniref:RNA polymerase-binding transcription factor DksA n=1 Tax=Rhodanobacter denitrificans TaxID=666685 RepID=A0A2W5M2T0_9GAMM|nr:MAG: RNA polymerase-binding protein DksA [Rhodanobacter denitrificans]
MRARGTLLATRLEATAPAVAGGGGLGYNTPPPSHKVMRQMAKSKGKSAAVGKAKPAPKAKAVGAGAKTAVKKAAKPPAKKTAVVKKPAPAPAKKAVKAAKTVKPAARAAAKPAPAPAKPAASSAKPAAKPSPVVKKAPVQARTVAKAKPAPAAKSPPPAPQPPAETSKSKGAVSSTNISSKASAAGVKARAVVPNAADSGITLQDGHYALPATVRIDLPAGFKPSAGEEYMNPKHLEYFRRKLQRWREDLVEESKQTIENLRDEVRDVGDEAERATRETENSLELRTRDRYRKLIAKIDKALKRIEEGRYGFCEETDEEIGLERLEARPIATLSLDAQERWEHRQKQMGD